MELKKNLEKELKGIRRESEVEPEPILSDRAQLAWLAV